MLRFVIAAGLVAVLARRRHALVWAARELGERRREIQASLERQRARLRLGVERRRGAGGSRAAPR